MELLRRRIPQFPIPDGIILYYLVFDSVFIHIISTTTKDSLVYGKSRSYWPRGTKSGKNAMEGERRERGERVTWSSSNYTVWRKRKHPYWSFPFFPSFPLSLLGTKNEANAHGSHNMFFIQLLLFLNFPLSSLPYIQNASFSSFFFLFFCWLFYQREQIAICTLVDFSLI